MFWSKCVGHVAPRDGQEGRGHGARSETGTLGTCARHDSWCMGQMLIAMETPVLPLRDMNLALAIAKVNKVNQTNGITIIAGRSTNKGSVSMSWRNK